MPHIAARRGRRDFVSRARPPRPASARLRGIPRQAGSKPPRTSSAHIAACRLTWTRVMAGSAQYRRASFLAPLQTASVASRHIIDHIVGLTLM